MLNTTQMVATDNGRVSRTHTLTFFTQNGGLVDQFVEDANQTKIDRVSVYFNSPRGWRPGGLLPMRGPETLFLPNDTFTMVKNHIDAFVSAKDEHHRKGIPHHTGIIIHGQPGTAKTSVIHTIACALRRDIYYLNLSAVSSEEELMELFLARAWDTALVVIEDIDAADVDIEKRSSREGQQTARKNVTMATLLNLLDGILTPEDLIAIATTNHIDKIDPAVIRPGRFDLVVELDYLGRPEFERMATFLDTDPSEYTLDYFHNMSGAELRMHLLAGGVQAVQAHQELLNQQRDKDAV